jgi:uncharacterized glyoxalase superfamily protein PhnB
VIDSQDQLGGWMQRTVKFVGALPAKERPRLLRSRQRRSAMAVAFLKTIPILRIFSVEKAKEFYVDYLGFSLDWEHHFEDNTPAYNQVSRAGLVLHLSEHHGDCCPGSTVFVWMTGIEEFHREITSKGYKYLRPGIETTFYKAKCVQVIDPFGNRIRFNEDLKPAKAT